MSSSRRLGWTGLCVLALMASGSSVESASSSLQGDAALAELERRGEKASLMEAVETALQSLAGPDYLKSGVSPCCKAGHQFGYSVAISENTVVVGAPFQQHLGFGVAFVFQRRGATWNVQVLPASDGPQGGRYAASVAVSGNVVVVGDPLKGVVYVWAHNGHNWEYRLLYPSDPASGDVFGSSVAISGRTLVVGAPGEDGDGVGVNPPINEAAADSGAAYVFAGSGLEWTQQAYLKASNTGASDAFGTSVAIAGNTVLVGAPGEDGSGTGMNPTPDEAAADAGAAYVFTRNGTTWSSNAYLKSFNPSAADGFGGSVAASWSTLVVGAAGEDGSGTGVDPISDEGAPSSGAAYVFVGNGITWSQQAYLKASNTGDSDAFGKSVAVSGNTVVAGAPEEAGSSGAAYVFLRNGTTWAQHAYLKASNTGAGDQFGYSVGVSKSGVVAGAPFEDGSGTYVNPVVDENAADAGAAYAFGGEELPALVDLNIDNGGDALLYGASSGAWSRQTSHADGGFIEQSLGEWSAGSTVLPADFNGDELTDFFLFDPITGSWSKMLANESGFTTDSSGTWWPGWQRHVMELNGDGISDLFLYDPITGAWFKCISTVTGFAYRQGGWSPGWELHPMSLNNDGFDDLFLFNRNTGRWFWALGLDDAGFTYPATDVWFPEWQLHPGDFNGDHLGDLLLFHQATGAYFVATTTASGFTYSQGAWAPGWSAHVADFDADARDDVFLHDESTGVWFEMISDGAGGFSNAGGETWSLGWTLHFTDVNADGRADILLYDPSTGVRYLARSLLNGPFTYSNGAWASGLTILTRGK